MSRISEFKTKHDAYMTRHDAALAGVKGDVDRLNAKIAELQATSGQLTPEDEALLTEIETAGEAAATKLEALDAENAPPVPTE